MQVVMNDHFGLLSSSSSSDDDDDDDILRNGQVPQNEEPQDDLRQQQPPPPPPPPPAPPQPPQRQQQRPRHPLIGKIGTIATIRQTHERIDSRSTTASSTTTTTTTNHQQQGSTVTQGRSSSGVWGRYEDATELVFTAVGISRFRIVDCIDDGSNNHQNNNHNNNIFIVEELIDEPIPRPMFQRPFSSSGPVTNQTSNNRDNHENNTTTTTTSRSPLSNRKIQQFAWCMSQLTPVPYFVYERLSPWCLVEKIVTSLRTNEGRNNLPSFGTNRELTTTVTTTTTTTDDDDIDIFVDRTILERTFCRQRSMID
jgi:hypothetical protein